MHHYTDMNEYLAKTLESVDLDKTKHEHPVLYEYLHHLISSFQHFIQQIDAENFWKNFPYIMGLDTRFVLLNRFLSMNDWVEYSDEELIQIIEQDYLNFTKEVCGFDLRENPYHSLIFDVE